MPKKAPRCAEIPTIPMLEIINFEPRHDPLEMKRKA
jgi:hypothetical protein